MERQVESRNRPAERRQERERRRRRRRSLTILVLGAAVWGLLALAGFRGLWISLVVVSVVAMLLIWNGIAGGPHTHAVAPPPEGEDLAEDPEAPPMEASPTRPNAVLTEYNTVTRVKQSPPLAHSQRGHSLPRRGIVVEAAEESSRMPPPVPPPLFGRPGSRPLLAGDAVMPRPVQGTDGAPVVEATAAEVAATGTVEAETAAAETDAAKTDAAKTDAAKTDAAKTDAAATKTAVTKTNAAKTVATNAAATETVVAEAVVTEAVPVGRTATGTDPAGTVPAVTVATVAIPEGAVSAQTGMAQGETAEVAIGWAPATPSAISQAETGQAVTVQAAIGQTATGQAATAQAQTVQVQTAGVQPGTAQPVPVATSAAAPVPPVTVQPVTAQAPVPSSYRLPTFDMLPLPQSKRVISEDEILERASLLERTLKTFGVEAKVVDFSFGPAVTRYELQPGPGVRVNKFTSLVDDLALALAAEDVRIEAPIPGKSAVGIEVPNKERLPVPLREVLESPLFRNNRSKLAVAFGKDNAGKPVVGDLARMPHLLIAGSTGSGKSVCMNSIISSLLFKARPDEVKMLMIDPKMVELSTYNGIPHLTAPVITDVRKAAGYLKGAVKEMEARYELFAASGARNIEQYNQMVAADPGPDPEHPRQPLPYIVIFIDELADLMMVAAADVEDSICRLAQMARACGMHLVIATQSPRVDVITGLIKANVPSRIAFAVSSQVDSRVIMDFAGAERLLGRGDMLYHPSGLPKPIRAQGAFIDEAAVDELVRFVKAQGEPVYTAEEVSVDPGQKRGSKGGGEDPSPTSAADAVFPQAVRIVIEHGQASVSILQRRLRCNYNKATRLIDMMEERGFIGPHQGSKPRDVLLSLPQWQEMFGEAAEEEQSEEEDLE